jgi:hypothetical protein
MSREPVRLSAALPVGRYLSDRKVSFAMIGASAMAVHGVSRSTADIDLLTADQRVLTQSFWQAWQGMADVRRGDDEDPLAGVVRLESTDAHQVDIVVGRSRWQRSLVEGADDLLVGTVALPVVGAAGLILLKLFAGGSQDRWDIEQLLAANPRSEIVHAIDERIKELPRDAQRLWAQLKGQH